MVEFCCSWTVLTAWAAASIYLQFLSEMNEKQILLIEIAVDILIIDTVNVPFQPCKWVLLWGEYTQTLSKIVI